VPPKAIISYLFLLLVFTQILNFNPEDYRKEALKKGYLFHLQMFIASQLWKVTITGRNIHADKAVERGMNTPHSIPSA
jgi:hypothetical protein